MQREDFKILEQEVNNRPLVYLDNAATTQKPESVINAISEYYRTINSNIHRGVHHLSQLATTRFEEAREAIRRYINAKNSYEIIFTRGATESINLIANSFLCCLFPMILCHSSGSLLLLVITTPTFSVQVGLNSKIF